MNHWSISAEYPGNIQITAPAEYNMGILILTGQVELNGINASKEQFVLFENEGTTVDINAIEEAKFLVLNGKPLNEPAIHKGPFVMNTAEEIEQAFEDVNSGKFGYLEEEKA